MTLLVSFVWNIEQLCENITKAYSLTFPDDAPIKAEQVKFNDYVIPPQYTVGEVFLNESEITVQSYQLGGIAEKFSTSVVTNTLPVTYSQKELLDAPKPTSIDNDQEDDAEQDRLMEEPEKRIRKLSESNEIGEAALARKRKQVRKELPLKKKKADEYSEPEAFSEVLGDSKDNSEDLAAKSVSQTTETIKAPQEKKQETKKEQKGRSQVQKEEVIYIREQEAEEIQKKRIRTPKEQKKVKPKRNAQKKLVKETEINDKQEKKIISSNKKLYKNLFNQ